MRMLRQRLNAYYIASAEYFDRGQMSQILRLSLAQLGPPHNPRLRAKAAETRQLIRLLPDLCRENAGHFR
eukprot:3504061-Pyramimonas_sp.AAC.1